MSIRCPEASLRKVKAVPIVCPACGYAETLAEPDESLDRALVDSTYIHTLRHELGLLERTEQFFARFPASKHRLKVSKTRRHRRELREIQDDPEFAAALRAQPDLYEFLTRSTFLLPARLPFVWECIQRLERDLDMSLVRCPRCTSGVLTIEDALLQRR